MGGGGNGVVCASKKVKLTNWLFVVGSIRMFGLKIAISDHSGFTKTKGVMLWVFHKNGTFPFVMLDASKTAMFMGIHSMNWASESYEEKTLRKPKEAFL